MSISSSDSPASRSTRTVRPSCLTRSRESLMEHVTWRTSSYSSPEGNCVPMSAARRYRRRAVHDGARRRVRPARFGCARDHTTELGVSLNWSAQLSLHPEGAIGRSVLLADGQVALPGGVGRVRRGAVFDLLVGDVGEPDRGGKVPGG
jgi:hypothetical protein